VRIAFSVVQIDGDVRKSLQVVSEIDPVVRANHIYKPLLNLPPNGKAPGQDLFAFLSETDKALSFRGALRYADKAVFFHQAQAASKCRRINN